MLERLKRRISLSVKRDDLTVYYRLLCRFNRKPAAAIPGAFR